MADPHPPCQILDSGSALAAPEAVDNPRSSALAAPEAVDDAHLHDEVDDVECGERRRSLLVVMATTSRSWCVEVIDDDAPKLSKAS